MLIYTPPAYEAKQDRNDREYKQDMNKATTERVNKGTE